MSENVISMEERIRPVFLTDQDTGNRYELDFSRDSVRFAENSGFKIDEVASFPLSRVSDLFYFSFRMHHRNMPREKTDKIMEKWGGLSESVLKRLIALYQQAALSNTIQTDEEAAAKNGRVTVEL